MQWLASLSNSSLDWQAMPNGYLNLTTQQSYKLDEVAAAKAKQPLQVMAEYARSAPPVRSFIGAIKAAHADGRTALIAEIKKASPSKGLIRADFDPPALARAYETGGAACLSILTDGPSFQGSPEYLTKARAAVSLPVLRKDFTVSANDVCDARLMGADAVLLIVAALSDGELAELSWVATEVGLDVLVETHDEAEVERAVAHTRGDLIGVNQRDLVTFQVDTDRAVRVAGAIPDGAVRVAESGIRGHDDAIILADAGYHAVLVGEHLVTSADPSAAVAALRVPREPV